MNTERFIDMLQNFETSRLAELFQQLEPEKWIHNPWFLAGTGIFALIALIMKWRLLLATVVSIVGLAGLMQYVIKQGTELSSLNNDSLIVFVCGGLLIAIIFIYLVFIKAE